MWASRGGGKTFLGAVATALDMLFKPGIEVRILGGSLDQSARMLAHLRRIFEHPLLRGRVEGKPTEKQIRLDTGSRVQVLAQSETAVRGTRVQKLRCDEVDLFDREIWEAAQLTTRSMRLPGPWGPWVRGSVEALSTMHRPFGVMFELVGSLARGVPAPGQAGERGDRRSRVLFRWGVVDALEACEASRACAECGLLPECGGRAKADRPGGAGHVTIDDALDLKSRVSRSAWASEMLCLRPKRDDAVYAEFTPARHVYAEGLGAAPQRFGSGPPDADRVPMPEPRRPRGEPPPPRLIAGMDFGYRGLTVVLWALVEPDGTVRVIDERATAGERLDAHIGAIIASPWGLPEWIGVDPAGRQANQQTGRSNIEQLERRGLVIRARALPVAVGTALVRARLDPAGPVQAAGLPASAGGATPASLLTLDGSPVGGAPPRLLIHARCGAVIESLQRHHYDPDRPDRYEPVKDGSDHAADALRYLVVNLDRPFRSVRREYATPRGAVRRVDGWRG
ncbi:MAG: hypothetical protein JNK35_00300 [Phycisphaerae bacterium]|nr:hypothetical protein [Phycisphaerae bacterium]